MRTISKVVLAGVTLAAAMPVVAQDWRPDGWRDNRGWEERRDWGDRRWEGRPEWGGRDDWRYRDPRFGYGVRLEGRGWRSIARAVGPRINDPGFARWVLWRYDFDRDGRIGQREADAFLRDQHYRGGPGFGWRGW